MRSNSYDDDFILRDIKREIAQHDRLHPKQQSQKPPAPELTIHFLDQVPDKPLTWLWPGRIPQCMDYPHHDLMVHATS